MKEHNMIRRPISESWNSCDAFQYTEGLLPKVRWRRRASVTLEASISSINRPTPTSPVEQFEVSATKHNYHVIGIHPLQKEKGVSQKRSLSNNNGSNICKKRTMSSWNWKILPTTHIHTQTTTQNLTEHYNMLHLNFHKRNDAAGYALAW